jgi:hypothetical protein
MPKGVIRNCKSKKDIQYNDQKKSDKMTNNNLSKSKRMWNIILLMSALCIKG